MYYISMLKKEHLKNLILNRIKKIPKKNLKIGLGVIAKGILGNEPLLTCSALDNDLKMMRK